MALVLTRLVPMRWSAYVRRRDRSHFGADSTVEGEATSHFLTESLSQTGVSVSRIAHGVPMGGTLEYIDGGTLFHAISGRKPV